MKRKCFIYKSSPNGRRHICIDLENAEMILEVIEGNDKYRKKFNHIASIILSGMRVPDLYDKENINAACAKVTAMKPFKQGDNARFYCQEISNDEGIFYVVVAEFLAKKKDSGNSKRIIPIIEKVASYEYEIVNPDRKSCKKV